MNACWAPEEKRQLHKHTQETFRVTISGPGFSVFIQQRITEYWLFFSFPVSIFDVGNRAKNKSVMVLAHQEFIGWPRGHVQLSSGFALAMTIGNCTIDPSCSLCLLDCRLPCDLAVPLLPRWIYFPTPLLVGWAMWLALTNGIWLRVTVSPLQVLSSKDIAWFHSSLGEPPTSAMKRTCSMCPDCPRRKRNTCSIIELNLEPNLICGAELNQNLQTQKHSWHQQSHPADSPMYE